MKDPIDKPRVNPETLEKYYWALTTLINEYLHSFRTPENMRKMVSLETTQYLRNRAMEDLKHILDIEVYRLIQGQKETDFNESHNRD